MAGKSVGQNISAEVLERLRELYRAILHSQIQGIIVEKLLKPAQKISARSMKGMDVVKMWARSQKITETRAIVEIARLVNLISEAETIGLRRAIGASRGIGLKMEKPRWDRARGELHFGEQIVRRIPRPDTATNIVPILNEFERRRWPARIEDPLPKGRDSQRLREAIATLNCNLKVIRFRADGTGRGVVWGVG